MAPGGGCGRRARENGWARAIGPILATAQAATRPAGVVATAPAVVDPSRPPPPDKALRMVIKGTLLLSFSLICLLMLVGFFASFREWVRYTTSDRGVRGRQKTRYVDAWKLAGERVKMQEGEEPEGEGGKEPLG